MGEISCKRYQGGVYLRVNLKRQFVEMIEYIEFPVIIYIYETGKVAALNKFAQIALNGGLCQNVNLLWSDQRKLKLSDDVLEGKSRYFFGKEILIGDNIKNIDMELNVITCGGEHIVIMFFDQSYKQPFRVDMDKLHPRLVWKDIDGTYTVISGKAKSDIEEYLALKSRLEEVSPQIRELFEEYNRIEIEVKVRQEPLFCHMEQINFEQDKPYYVRMNRIPIYDKKIGYQGMLLMYMPVLSKDDYETLFNYSLCENATLRDCLMSEGIIMVGLTYEETLPIIYATPNIQKFGYSIETIMEQQMTWRDLIHEEDAERVMEELQKGILRKEKSIHQKFRIKTLDENEIWVDSITFGKDFCTGEYIKIILKMVQSAVSEPARKILMKKETYLDFLTGLPNRMKYEEDAQKQIEVALTNHKKGFVIMLDLDDFRHINEAFGTEYGDILLKQVAKALNDIPEIENYCYRVDGDEFLLFVKGEYAKQTEEIIQQCLKLFHTSWTLEDKECFCSVSIGITEYPKDSANPKELLKYADAAVYEAKKKGKNRIQHYKKAVLNSSIARVNYEKHLRKAITKGCVEFEMFFQPIVRTTTKEVISAEALVRWYSPELGFITPINFISLSEYLGLIVPLGEYVLKETFSACKRWNDTYNKDFKVAVNLSVVQLVQPNIVERIMEIARVTGVNTDNIILEVTESLAVEDMNLMKSVLNQLRENGFSIALDDFGTGYSSLNHIMEMPLNYVKIDKSFVSGYGTESFNPSLLSAITELAHSVNMEVVVEGVETKQQMEFLMFLNTDKLQGYLYGKPMPREEFEQRFFEAVYKN